MSNGTPTPAQIQQVQTNLVNMQAFNNSVYNTVAEYNIPRAYDLLSQHDSSDPGLSIVLDILAGAISAIGSGFGAAGSFASTFLGGLITSWGSQTPKSLKTTFASLLARMEATKFEVWKTLGNLYDNVPGNWNTQFTFNGQTAALSDFANVVFPIHINQATMVQAAVFGMDQLVWQYVLQESFVVTFYQLEPPGGPTPGKQDDPPVRYDEAIIAANPSYYNSWYWHQASGHCDTSGWIINQYSLGLSASNNLSTAACHHLFIDSAPGVVINANGLYKRGTVFNNLNIRHKTHIVIVGSGLATSDKLSPGYLRAMKTGATLGALVERDGRAAIEQRVIERAQRDLAFALDLKIRPRETIEKFLGVRIPDVVSINVTIEDPRSFGFVVPMKHPS
jgi:hypothetical protein